MSTITTPNSSKKREKLLLIVAGVLILLILLYFLSSFFGGGANNLLNRRVVLREKVNDLERKVRRGVAIEEKLKDFASRSLPPTGEIAQSQYQKWLFDQAVKSGFQNAKAGIASVSKVDKNTGFRNYSFKLEGRATLQQVTNFLQEFYEVNHLHLIKNIALKTVAQTGQLEVTMVVESIALDAAKPTKTISMSVNPTPNWVETLKEQVRYVAKRSFFAPYAPPVPPPPVQESAPGLDAYTEAFLTYISAIVEVDGEYQVWIERRLTGERQKLFVGNHFLLGGIDCVVKSIDFDYLTIEVAVPDEETGEIGTAEMMYKVGRNFEQPLE